MKHGGDQPTNLDRKDAIRTMLDMAGVNAGLQCRQLAFRFREALMGANPDLTSESMKAYDEAFAEELPALEAALQEARIEAAAGTLSEGQFAAWRMLGVLSETSIFFDSLRSLGHVFGAADRDVFKSLGAAAHARSAERLFERLGSE